MLPSTQTTADAVLTSPGFPKGLLVFDPMNPRRIQKAHLDGCAARTTQDYFDRNEHAYLSLCSCAQQACNGHTREGHWLDLVATAQIVDTTAARLADLEKSNAHLTEPRFADEFLERHAGLPLNLGPRILGHFPLLASQDHRGALVRLRGVTKTVGNPQLSDALGAVCAVADALPDRYLTAMGMWPWEKLFSQVFWPKPKSDADQLVITNSGRIKAACAGAGDEEDGRPTLEALALVSTPILGWGHAGKGNGDDLIAMRVPATWADSLKKYWLWSADYPQDLTPDHVQQVTQMMATYDAPLGGPAEQLEAALAAVR